MATGDGESGTDVSPPAAKCLLLVSDGLSTAEWAAEPQGPVRVELRATALGGNGVEDRWVVQMRAPVLDAVSQDAGHWRVVDHTPIEAQRHQLSRRYPASL